MSQVAERSDTLAAAFDAFRREPAFAAGGLGSTREAAYARFADIGFPTTRDEEWKFTNVAPIARTEFARAAAADLAPNAAEPFLLAAEMPHRVVLVNGRWSPSLSSIASLPKGVSVRSLRDVLESAASKLRGSLGDLPAHTPFVDLNTAFFEDGVIVDVDPKIVVDEPLHIIFLTTASQK